MNKELNAIDLIDLHMLASKLKAISERSGMAISLTSLSSPTGRGTFVSAHLTPDQKMMRAPSLSLRFEPNGNVTAELCESYPSMTSKELFIDKNWTTKDTIEVSKKINELIKEAEVYEREHFGRNH